MLIAPVRSIMKLFPCLAALLIHSFCLAENQGGGEYRLVWADEFEKSGRPNPAHWVFEQGFCRNMELQWYQPQNAICQGGKLIIEGRKERRRNPTFVRGSKDWRKSREFIEYTSACVTTQGRHSWQFGRFEIKAKIKSSAGLWPAIWTLGIDGKWPNNGEVDILECYKGNILANACWGTKKDYAPQWDSIKKPVSSFNDPKWDEKFHIWRMDWDEKEIKLYVDDLLLNTIDLTKTLNAKDGAPKNPFLQPHYLLLNLAIGGQPAGDPKGTVFPSRYEIDYVRVYQKAQNQTR